MKITRLKLENFLGIKHGMNKTEIEIDFSKCVNTITMILGRNGSGKSTILSQLHPFKDSFDDRKDLIIDGVDGRKEIDYEVGDNTYKIVHIYSKIAQSFISKNGVELNESGGVKTCEDIIRRELGLTKDYFKIGKIGSNTKNFVGFTAAERKNYIGTFINMDDYLAAFKTVKEKYTSSKKTISDIGDRLKNIEEQQILEAKKNAITSELKRLYDAISADHVTEGSLRNRIDICRTDLAACGDLSFIQNQISSKKDLLEEYKDVVKLNEERFNNVDIDDFIDNLQKDINSKTSDLRVAITDKSNQSNLLADYEKREKSVRLQIESLGSEEDVAKLSGEIESLNNSLLEKQTAISNNPAAPLVRQMLGDKKDVNRHISQFVDFSDFIEKYFSELSACDFSNSTQNMEYFLQSDFRESFERQLHESVITINEKNKLLDDLKEELAKLEANENQASILSQRPTDCHIDGCPFIKEALKYRNIESLIANHRSSIASMKEHLTILQEKNENLNKLFDIYKEFVVKIENLNGRDNDIFKHFFSKTPLVGITKEPLSAFSKNRQNLIQNAENAQQLFVEYITLKHKLNNLTEARNKIVDANNSMKETFVNDLNDILENKKSLENKMVDVDTNISSINSDIERLQNDIELATQYKTAVSSMETIAFDIGTFETLRDAIIKNTDSIRNDSAALEDILVNISNNEKQKDILDADLRDVDLKIRMREDLTKTLADLEKEYNKLQCLFSALNPNTGIPLIMVQNYLGETESIANNLLNIAYGGDFSIKFNITDKEFLISVISKGNVKDDIRVASQGEMALTTISLSLALIQQASGDYNILSLDEIDGPLDKDNRENFINILNSQISKLGIEQVFVISHNNAFDICPMDLILLSGNSVNKEDPVFMENKNIIYDVAT